MDIYSVGIIFFEMCHPPAATAMERHKLLVNIRKKEIIFPSTFDKEKQNQVCVKAALNSQQHGSYVTTFTYCSPHSACVQYLVQYY